MINVLYNRNNTNKYSREILVNDLVKHNLNQNILLEIIPEVENSLNSFKDVYVARLISEVGEKYLDYIETNNSKEDISNLSDYLETHLNRYEDIEFSRIRRITGYLVGSLSRFNNAKLAEVKERVKHA
jgi:ribonucleoside-triphosphate reductase